MTTMISEHFSEAEMACKHCGALVTSCVLMAALEQLRLIIGQPLPIVSGYRCRTHNRAVGGAPRSMHVLGKAADWPASLGVGIEQALLAGFRGIGTKGAVVVHGDVRTTGITHWRY